MARRKVTMQTLLSRCCWAHAARFQCPHHSMYNVATLLPGPLPHLIQGRVSADRACVCAYIRLLEGEDISVVAHAARQ